MEWRYVAVYIIRSLLLVSIIFYHCPFSIFLHLTCPVVFLFLLFIFTMFLVLFLVFSLVCNFEWHEQFALHLIPYYYHHHVRHPW